MPEDTSKENVSIGALAEVRQDPVPPFMDKAMTWLSGTFHAHSGLIALKPGSLDSMELSFSRSSSDIACKACKSSGECVNRSGSHLAFAGR